MSSDRIVEALKHEANVAVAYSEAIGKLLDSFSAVNQRLDGLTLEQLSTGPVAWTAVLHVCKKHGIGIQGLVAPDPSFSRERFLAESASIYDALDLYYGAVKKEKLDETDNGRSGPRT